jgi:hypothetical protein
MPTCRCGKNWPLGRYCPFCGADSADIYNYNPLQPPELVPRFCPLCKHPINIQTVNGRTVYVCTNTTCPKQNPNTALTEADVGVTSDICRNCGVRRVVPGMAVCQECYKAGGRVRNPSAGTGGIRGAVRRTSDLHAEKIAKKLKNRYLEIIALFVAGALVIMLSGGVFTYLGAALMIYAFEVFLPTEHDILSKVKKGEYLEITEHMGPLFARAMIKFIFYFLIILQFFMINQPVPALIATFVGYFSMPTYYKTSRPYKAIEAWVRLGFGVLLSIEMYAIFSLQNILTVVFLMVSTGGLYILSIFNQMITNVGSSSASAANLFFLSAAFFIVFPSRIVDENDDRKVFVGVSVGKHISAAVNQTLTDASKKLNDYVFLIIAGIAGFPILFWLSGAWSNFMIVYLVVWLMSLFAGYFGGPAGRPYIGIIIIVFSLFAFSTSLPGYVGQAIFGIWWPQVENVITTVTTPLTPMWAQMNKGFSDAWLLMTNPALYYERMMESTQASQSVVTTGGLTTSIELNGFDFSGISTLDPSESFLGSVELENKGEFNANYIDLKLQTLWHNATSLENVALGKFDRIGCGPDVTSPSSLPNNIVECKWDKITYPGELKIVTFKIQRDDTSSPPWTGIWGFVREENTSTNTYMQGGTTVKINASLDYNYNVNVSLPVEVINYNKYYELVQARQIQLSTLESQYSGGPVKATIWSQKQPLRSGDDSIIRVYIKNEGVGNLTQVTNYIIYVPNELNATQVASSSFKNGCPEDTLFTKNIKSGYDGIICTTNPSNKNEEEIAPGDYGVVSFYIHPPQDVTFERKTFLITAVGSYKYEKFAEAGLQVVMVKHAV